MKSILVILVLVLNYVCDAQILGKDNIVEISGITLKGKVTDVNGVALTGADILVIGTSNVTKTNFDGEFYLTVNKGDDISINYHGFNTKTITLVDQAEINIRLEEKDKQESLKALTKSEIRKKKRSENKAKQAPQRNNSEPLDLGQFLIEGAGRTAETMIRKKRNE